MERGADTFRNVQRFSGESWPGTGYLSKPFGYSNFPKEIIPSPKSWVEKEGNLVFYREHEKVCSFSLSLLVLCILGFWDGFEARGRADFELGRTFCGVGATRVVDGRRRRVC